jgi:hypothetical protein
MKTSKGVVLISKTHAIAILSGHPRCCKDRSLRVKALARLIALLPAKLDLLVPFAVDL